jgi:hypothetical protein
VDIVPSKQPLLLLAVFAMAARDWIDCVVKASDAPRLKTAMQIARSAGEIILRCTMLEIILLRERVDDVFMMLLVLLERDRQKYTGSAAADGGGHGGGRADAVRWRWWIMVTSVIFGGNIEDCRYLGGNIHHHPQSRRKPKAKIDLTMTRCWLEVPP